MQAFVDIIMQPHFEGDEENDQINSPTTEGLASFETAISEQKFLVARKARVRTVRNAVRSSAKKDKVYSRRPGRAETKVDVFDA